MRAVRWGWIGGLVVGAALAAGARAGELSQTEALDWLQRIAAAARTLNYEGTFVYQHGDSVETSRITHMADGGTEHEKLTTLDGPPREVIRNDDEVLSYYPEIKTVRAEHRGPGRSFPNLLPEQLQTITEHYIIRKMELERVAGFDAQTLMLEPKDNLRYGHKFWAAIGTGLLLRARMLNERNQVVEQFAFTQLNIVAKLALDDVKSTYASEQAKWKVDRISSNAQIDSGWEIKNQPPGFRKVMEMRRSKQSGGPRSLTHIVLTDGLAAVSVFIEPGPMKQPVSEGAAQHGAINIFTRMVGDHRVTVLGETPAATVRLIADSISLKAK